MDSTLVSSSDESTTKTTYTILLDDGTTVECKFEDLIDKVDAQPAATEGHANAFAGLPAFLSEGSKVTTDHNGAFHKGFIHHSPSAGYHVAIKRNLWSNKINFTVPLPNFRQDWSSLVGDNILLPGHTTVSSFLVPIPPTMHRQPTTSLPRICCTHVLLHSSKHFIRPTLIAMCGSNRTKKKKGG
jgi:hypothetical protein